MRAMRLPNSRMTCRYSSPLLSSLHRIDPGDQFLHVAGAILLPQHRINPEQRLGTILAQLDQDVERIACQRPSRGWLIAARRRSVRSAAVHSRGLGCQREVIDLARQRRDDRVGHALADLGQALEQGNVTISDGSGDLMGAHAHGTQGALVTHALAGGKQLVEPPIFECQEPRQPGDHGGSLALGFDEVDGVELNGLADGRPQPLGCVG